MKALIIEDWDKDNFYENLQKTTQLIFVDIQNFEAIEHYIYTVVSSEEIYKSKQFLKKKNKAAYLLGKYVLRLLLGKIEAIPPKAVDFLFSENRKPFFRTHEFNITHSENHIYIAFSPLAVGVDTEEIHINLDILPIVESYFSFKERALFNISKSYIDFYKIWTRKEALLKATGEGICNDMKDIEVLDDLVYRNGNTYLITTRMHGDYIVSIAALYRDEHISCSSFNPFSL